MIARLGSNWYLRPHQYTQTRKGDRQGACSETHFALIQSIIVSAGFPMLSGSRPSAVASGALIVPAPGRSPSALGYVLSMFVARNAQSALRRRYVNALESFV